MTLKGYSIYVYGYTDDVGTQDYNLKLSSRRAQAVRDSLVQAGINPGLITTKGFGQSDPRVKDHSAQGPRSESPRGDWHCRLTAALRTSPGKIIISWELQPARFPSERGG